MKRWILVSPIAILAALCLCHTSCRKQALSSGPDSAQAIVLPSGGTGVIAAENQFSIDLFHAVLHNDTARHNIMISPFSIYMALGMTDNGAVGPTRDSISEALRLGSSSLDDLNSTAGALIGQMPKADPTVTMAIANSIWYNQSLLSPLPSFLRTVQGSYNAKIEGLSFSDPLALTTINQWVATQTQQMIKNMLSGLSGKMVLINAIYFKGNWTYQFNADSTQNAPFVMSNGVTESVPLMSVTLNGTVPYYANDSLTLIDLPYGGEHFSLFALMPGVQTNIHTLAEAMNPSNLASWESGMGLSNIQLYFPKFSFSYSTGDMHPELSTLGMGLAFQSTADFSDMYQQPTQIGAVLHKTAIQVDESGTKAAAASAVLMTSLASPDIIPVRFDHPFIFVIQEKTSGVILFAGVLNDPLDAGS
jgi:serpin B